jgi:hypothetical protein
VLLQHLLDVGEELEGHIANVLVAPDDVIVDKVSFRFIVGGLLVFDLCLQLGDVPT